MTKEISVDVVETRGRIRTLKELIELISKKLVEHPEDVQVRVIEGEEVQTFELRVHPDDMGRIIGKQGRVAKNLRAIVGAAAAKQNVNARLDIVEENE